MKKVYILLAAVALSLTSCATIFTGSKDTLRFDSDPEGATVLIDGLEVCTTPCTTQVKRSLSDKLAEIKLENYETRVITLDREFNAVSVLNLGFLLGWGIDAATGALMKYDRKGYDIELESKKVVSLENIQKLEFDTGEKSLNVYVIQN